MCTHTRTFWDMYGAVSTCQVVFLCLQQQKEPAWWREVPGGGARTRACPAPANVTKHRRQLGTGAGEGTGIGARDRDRPWGSVKHVAPHGPRLACACGHRSGVCPTPPPPVWPAQAEAEREHRRKMEAMREWSDEELRMLDKAVAKFPQVRAEQKRAHAVHPLWGAVTRGPREPLWSVCGGFGIG